jgi:hypothetical protein
MALRGIVWVIWADLGYGSTVRASAARSRGRCAGRRRRGRTRRRGVRSCQPRCTLPHVPRAVFVTGGSGRGCGHAGRRRSSARSNLESQKAIRIPQPARSSQGWHVCIMSDFCAPSTALPAAPRAGFRPNSPPFSPTHFHEDPASLATFRCRNDGGQRPEVRSGGRGSGLSAQFARPARHRVQSLARGVTRRAARPGRGS